jgi:hypothetical protein
MTTPPRKLPDASLSRRNLLIGAAAVATAGLPVASLQGIPEIGSRAETAILALVRHRESATVLGNAALSSWPDLRDHKTLLANILDDLRMDGDSVARARVPDIASRLAVRIRDDFAVARTVMLDGWLLSLAETRLYALAALAQNR